MMKRILFSLLLLAPFFASAQTNDFKWIKQQTYTATGTDTYSVTVTGVTAYTIGLEVKILFTNANTGPATLNINSLGAKTLRKNGSSALASGDLAAGATYRLTYDGTYLQVLGLGGAGGGSMVYPGAGIPLSTGSAWGTSITDNSANWNTAFGWGNHADRYIKKYGNTYLGTSVNMIADSLYSAFSLRVGAVDTAYSQLNMYKNLVGDVGFSIVSQNNITGEGTLFDNSPTGSSIASSGGIVFNGNGATITLNGAGIQFEDPTISENNGSIYIRQGGYVKPLPIGSANQVLTVSGSAPVWSTPTVYGDMFLGTSQTVTAAKTFNTGTFSLRNPANTFSYNFLGSAIVANRTVTLPLLTGNDTFVMLSHTQNLVNKTFELSQNVLTGLKADFNTAVSDGDFLFVNDAIASGGNTDITSNVTVTSPDGTARNVTFDFNGPGRTGGFNVVANSTTPISLSGNVNVDGQLLVDPSGTALSSFRIPHGTAPSSPVDGDLWSTTSGFYARVNGVTVGPFSAGGGSGDVVGPASAVNNNVVFFDGTTGKLIKDSGLTLSGSNTGDQTTITGNAGTATTLQTTRTIWGQNFNGSANVTGNLTLGNSSLLDANGNEVVTLSGVASAINEVTIQNASASGFPSIYPTGGDTDIGLAISGKGTGQVYIPGYVLIGGGSYSSGTAPSINITGNGIASTATSTGGVVINGGQSNASSASTSGSVSLTSGAAIGTNTSSGSITLATQAPTGSGSEGAVEIQTRSTGKVGFFAATPVVKQSAVTSLHEISDALTAYGLLPSSTISVIELNETAAPSAPSANKVQLYAKDNAGFSDLIFKNSTNAAVPIQTHIGYTRYAQWSPSGNATTLTTIGTGGLTATGTATAVNVATTNIHTIQRGLEWLVTTPATTAVAGFRWPNNQWFFGNSAGFGGFKFICRWGPATGVSVTTTRAFTGMTTGTGAPTDVEPSSLTNIIGMAWDAADANIQFMHNDASGTATKVDLGSNFPVPTTDRTDAYEITMYAPPNSTTLYYEIVNMSTGNRATGNVNTNIPAVNTLMSPRGWVSVGGTSSVIGIKMMNMIIESDY